MTPQDPKLTPETHNHQSARVRSTSWIGALGVLAIYALTMSRDMGALDSPELALVAFELGLGHPPGQPLYTMLGHLFAHVPGVPTLIGLNFMSALAGALTVVPACLIAERMTNTHALNRSAHGWIVGVISLGALQPVLWEPATRIEVYSLATLLSVCGLERVQLALMPANETHRVHPLLVGALWLGLAACVNPVVALSCVVCVAPLILSAAFRAHLSWRVLSLSILTGTLALLPYLYVIAVADRIDVLVWGAPTDAATLLDYLRGSDYARNTGITFSAWFAHAIEWCGASLERFGALWLLVGITAHAGYGKHGLGRLTVTLLLLLSIALVCANQVFRVDNPDYHGYLATPFWLCVVGVAVSVQQMAAQPGNVWRLALLCTLLLASMWRTDPPLTSRTRADDHITRDLVASALQAAPRNALVVVETDHWIAPALYLQRVEKLRPDVVVLGAGLASSAWYWNLIYRDHPSLQPFALRGAGGRDARIQRFLAQQPMRAVLVEHVELALRVGVTPCMGGALLATGVCSQVSGNNNAHQFAHQLARAVQQHSAHVPLATEFVAALGLQRGEDLWRLGQPNAALHVLLAAIPASLRADLEINWRGLSKTPPLRRPSTPWRRQPVFGEPARNLYVAAELLFMAGQTQGSQQLADVAAKLGLPEALSF